jgi:hypothetical protein
MAEAEMTTIKELWDSYAKDVVPKDAPTVQRWETRRAFYAGAQAVFMSILTMLDPGTEPTEADLRKMDALDQELRIFKEEVRAGRA